ncbi:MAG: porin [Planctomycetales bacterium]|nr:porin [Planctomycetales bacterium]
MRVHWRHAACLCAVLAFSALVPSSSHAQLLGELGDSFDFWDSFAGEDAILDVGGWAQFGRHGHSNGLFNSHPHNYNLHQGWLYVDKAASTEEHLIGFGGRMDLMYGVDAADTQAFGGLGWDTGWNHGDYGWAMPQLYGEMAIGNFSTKVGHFFTLIGYEVVTAPDNFFYSHAMTMYNSEPFTHTGVLTSYAMGDIATIYGGWTLGWDTGFESLNAGSSYLGGIGLNITDDIVFTYMCTAGNFGDRSGGNGGYSHSILLDMSITEKLNYIVQSDMLRVAATSENNIGLNQYLLYSLSDRVGAGLRMEWWQGDDVTGYDYGGRSAAPTDDTSYYAVTAGLNYKPHANITMRPEIRWNWSPALDFDEAVFGMDWYLTF